MYCLQNHHVMVTFVCCCADGRGAHQSPNHWRSYKIRGKMDCEIGGDRGMVMEVEGVWKLGGMMILSCIEAGIRI